MDCEPVMETSQKLVQNVAKFWSIGVKYVLSVRSKVQHYWISKFCIAYILGYLSTYQTISGLEFLGKSSERSGMSMWRRTVFENAPTHMCNG